MELTPTLDWGSRIREARRSAGLSQTELGRRVGVLQCTISDWERGEHRPPDARKMQLAEALDVPVPDLFPWPEAVA